MPGTHGNVTGEVKSQQKVNRYKMGWKGVIFKASVSFREWRQYKGRTPLLLPWKTLPVTPSSLSGQIFLSYVC